MALMALIAGDLPGVNRERLDLVIPCQGLYYLHDFHRRHLLFSYTISSFIYISIIVYVNADIQGIKYMFILISWDMRIVIRLNVH